MIVTDCYEVHVQPPRIEKALDVWAHPPPRGLCLPVVPLSPPSPLAGSQLRQLMRLPATVSNWTCLGKLRLGRMGALEL